MSYKFKGYSWHELAECWGITVEEKRIHVDGLSKDSELCDKFKIKESIDVVRFINGMKITFTVNDEDEVLAEKIKQHMKNNIDLSTGKFKDGNMRKDINLFLKALIKESNKYDYNHPMFEGMLKIESDITLYQWISNNLEKMWT